MSPKNHSREVERIILSLGALAAGFALGLLYMSPKGQKARWRVAHEASRGVKWLDRQLDEARERIVAAGDEAADHIRSAVEDTIDKVIPSFGTEDDWKDVYSATEEEVRRAKQ